MVNIDYYVSAGYALELLSRSQYHRKQKFGDYFRTEILPALWTSQVKFYVSKDYAPTAMVTWAWLNEEVERDIHATGRALQPEEWNSGDRLFFNDWVTPFNNIRGVVHDMTHRVFPDEIATSLRRNPDGTVRRINRWTGVNLRRAAAPVAEDVA